MVKRATMSAELLAVTPRAERMVELVGRRLGGGHD